MVKMNRLCGTRAYLAGAMDRVPDGGVVWREKITEVLKPLGVTILDPCKKPIDIGGEDLEDREFRAELKRSGQYEALSKKMKLIRITDLRLVDVSDFLIVYVNTDVHMCGTYEEVVLANRQKKPILLMVEGGTKNTPDWLFGMLPYQHFFSSWHTLMGYVKHVHEEESVKHYKRWMFLDYSKISSMEPV